MFTKNLKASSSVVGVCIVITLALAASANGGIPSASKNSAEHTWTFEELGIGTVTYMPRPISFDRPTVFYELPPTVSKGGKYRRILSLHLVIDLNETAASGSEAVIGVTSNEAGSAYIKLMAKTKDGRIDVTWAEVGEINGTVEHKTRRNHLDIWYSNYLPIAGVRSGRNRLSFMVKQQDLVQKLVIMPDSSIEQTLRAPAQIVISENIGKARFAVGEIVPVRVTIRNRGGRKATKINVAIDHDTKAFTVIGASSRTPGDIKPNRDRTMTFKLRAKRVGKYPIGISAGSASNQQVALRYVTVAATPLVQVDAEGSGEGSKRAAEVLAITLAAIGLIGAVISTRVRHAVHWATSALAGAGTVAFWSLLIGVTLATSIVFTLIIVAATFASTLVATRKLHSGGGLGLALFAIPVLAVVMNGVILFLLFVIAAITGDLT